MCVCVCVYVRTCVCVWKVVVVVARGVGLGGNMNVGVCNFGQLASANVDSLFLDHSRSTPTESSPTFDVTLWTYQAREVF